MAEYYNDSDWKEEEEETGRLAGVLTEQEVSGKVLGRERLGATKEYDRGKIGDPSANKRFHESQFGDKKTVQGSNGETLHRDHDAAKRKYGPKWQEHAAEADHIDPLKNIHERHAKNAFLTDEDIKEVANRQGNFQELSRRENGPSNKGSKSEFQRGCETKDPKRMVRGLKAQAETDALLTQRAAKNAARVTHNAGKEVGMQAGAMTLATSGINNMVAVIKGEKEAGEALADTARDGGKAAVAGYFTAGGLEAVTQILTNSSSQFVRSLASANVPAKVITAVTLVGGTMKEYFTGEITTSECITKLGETGFNVAVTGQAMLIGQALIPIPIIGGAVGALVGSFLSSQLCGKVGETLRRKDLEHQERLRLQAEYKKAAEQARAFRQELESYLDNYFQDCRACFDEALSEIYLAFQSGDAEGVVQGANKLTRKLGGTVPFSNREEFGEYLLSDSIDVL